jgi:hypothetical protein
MGTPTLALLAVPVISKETGRPLGVVELLNKKKTTQFTKENELEIALVAKMIGHLVEKAVQDVKDDIEKKGLKRIHMSNTEEGKVNARTQGRRRSSTPIFHFKPVLPDTKPSDISPNF